MSLTATVTKGVKWTAGATAIKALFQLALLAIAARFLTPESFGLYAIVQITLGFCQLFMDMGLGNAIIHQQNVKPRHLSELFIINLLIGLLISFLTFILANHIAIFFDSPKLTPLVQLISPSFTLAALFRIHLVVLQKNLTFSMIAKIEIFAQLVGFSVAIAGLVFGYGVESLIIGYMANLVCQGGLFWCYSPYKLLWCIPTSMRELKGYFSFGAYQTGDATINYFNSQFDLILVGKLLGNEVLGGYALARHFCFRPAMVINPVLTRVAFPVMAKLKNSEKLPTIYCKLLSVLAAINFPLYIALAIFAEPIVFTLFGDQWLHIVPIFQLMALWCLVRSAMNPVGSLMMALGKVRKVFFWNLSLTFIIPITVYLGSTYQLEGIVIALLLLQVLLLIVHWYVLLYRGGNVSGRMFSNALIYPLLTSLVSGTFSYAVTLAISNFMLQLTVGVSVGVVTYLLLSIKMNPTIINLLKGQLSFD